MKRTQAKKWQIFCRHWQTLKMLVTFCQRFATNHYDAAKWLCQSEPSDMFNLIVPTTLINEINILKPIFAGLSKRNGKENERRGITSLSCISQKACVNRSCTTGGTAGREHRRVRTASSSFWAASVSLSEAAVRSSKWLTWEQSLCFPLLYEQFLRRGRCNRSCNAYRGLHWSCNAP